MVKKWDKEHPEIIKLGAKKWRDNNKQYFKDYYITHKKTMIASMQKYQASNPLYYQKYIKPYQKKYRENNSANIKAYNFQYNIDNKDKLFKQRKQYYLDNKDKFKEYQRRYREKHKNAK